MTVIEISDREAALLKAKAAAQGLTLEAWLKKLAEEASPGLSLSPREVAAQIRQIRDRTHPDPEGWTIRDYIQHGRR